jgi:hypothetical protein
MRMITPLKKQALKVKIRIGKKSIQTLVTVEVETESQRQDKKKT